MFENLKNLYTNDLINTEEQNDSDYYSDHNEVINEYGEIKTNHGIDMSDVFDEDELIERLDANPTFPNFAILYADKIQGMTKQQADRYLENIKLKYLERKHVKNAVTVSNPNDHAKVGHGRPITKKGQFGELKKHPTQRNTRQFKSITQEMVNGKRMRKISNEDRVHRYSKAQTELNHSRGEYSRKWDYSNNYTIMRINDVELKLLQQSFGAGKSLTQILRMIVDIECTLQEELNDN
ncbi:hypothetical protein [Moritella viscosa]|uniref:Oligopeptide ABC transporter, permease protein n=1 Tax=Moritella viscosa TaxID=80854 RepID=A0A1L0AL37_9GAMM|nr:hypothetical protein [Moritella viscosa]SGZ17335.1 Oligopeptide ABC transporter, permease protein [Moritella viscosa]